jgi:plasmid segregation protein ParM
MGITAVDIGFGFTKGIQGTDKIIFKSIIGDTENLQFWSHFAAEDTSDYFHLTVDGKPVFVGDLAEQQSDVHYFTLDQEKLMSDFVKILALTAVGHYAEDDTSVRLISGLPVVFYKKNRLRFIEILKGRHDLVFHDSQGHQTKKQIHIESVHLVPQPLGSALNRIVNDNGEMVHDVTTQSKIGVIDIGFKTSDVIVLDHLKYISRASKTMDIGISNAFAIIANTLRERSGVNIELYRMYDAVKKGSIKIRGQVFDFSNIKKQVYSRIAGMIANDLERLWASDWDMDTIILSGGGGAELAPYLAPLITGHVLPVDNNIDNRFNNVEGYLKYGQFMLDQAGME